MSTSMKATLLTLALASGGCGWVFDDEETSGEPMGAAEPMPDPEPYPEPPLEEPFTGECPPAAWSEAIDSQTPTSSTPPGSAST